MKVLLHITQLKVSMYVTLYLIVKQTASEQLLSQSPSKFWGTFVCTHLLRNPVFKKGNAKGGHKLKK